MPQPQTCLGIDVGGSGIKGGVVDLDQGTLIGDRHKILTPSPATPNAVASVVKEIVTHFEWTGPVGITIPSVVTQGVTQTATNLDSGWVGLNAESLFTATLGTQVAVINDADAAGLAEVRYGAAQNFNGSVILLTLGTGIGSALIINDTLYPNSELGQLIIGDKTAEKRAAASVREAKDLSWEQWSAQLNKVLEEYEKLFWPDLFIIGGGISRKMDKWVNYLHIKTPLVAATLQNTAGIVGVASLAHQKFVGN